MSGHRAIEDLRRAERSRPLINHVATQVDVNTNVTPADVLGLAVFVDSGKKYRVSGRLFLTVGATGGLRLQINGTCVLQDAALSVVVLNYVSPAVTGGRLTALATAPVTAAGQTAYDVWIEGFVRIDGAPKSAGTFGIQFAQSVSDGTNCSVLVDSFIELHEHATAVTTLNS